jgi:cell division protein FtsB
LFLSTFYQANDLKDRLRFKGRTCLLQETIAPHPERLKALAQEELEMEAQIARLGQPVDL